MILGYRIMEVLIVVLVGLTERFISILEGI